MPGLNYLNDIEYHRRITRDDLVHHLLGNGLIQAVVQVTENLAARNALVLHLMSPERFEGRHKSESFTFHRQLGPELTLVGVRHGGEVYVANPRQAACDLRYRLDFSGGEPVFRASYPLDFTLEGRRAKTPRPLPRIALTSIASEGRNPIRPGLRPRGDGPARRPPPLAPTSRPRDADGPRSYSGPPGEGIPLRQGHLSPSPGSPPSPASPSRLSPMRFRSAASVA